MVLYIMFLFSNVYLNASQEILYFGLRNVEPVARELKEAGLNDADINRISYNMAKHIR